MCCLLFGRVGDAARHNKGDDVAAVYCAQLSKLYYTKSAISEAIKRSQVQRYTDLFQELLAGGYVTCAQLCGRLNHDGKGVLRAAAEAWYAECRRDR